MPDVDTFELRFAAAYRRYLDEVDTAVDAAAVARSLAGGALRRRAGIDGWFVRPVPAGAWLLLVTLLIAALAGAWLIGQQVRELPVLPATSEPPSPAPSGSVGLTGTWSDHGAWQAVLALHPCGPGEACGRLKLTVDDGDGPRCGYTLEHRPPAGGDYAYWTAEASFLGGAIQDSAHCPYDFGHVELRVRPLAAGSVLVWQRDVPRISWTLSLVSEQYEPTWP